MSVSALLALGRQRLDPAEAAILLAHVLQRSRGWLVAHAGDAVDAAGQGRYAGLLERRVAGEPVAYLTGRQGFWTLDLSVSPATLIPRPETELLVELALARVPSDAIVRVADLGTGSGAIALAIASERPRAQVVATDASAAALEVARANAIGNGIANVEFRQGDWLAPLAGERHALIASNPPYVAEEDPHLDQGDLRHEPASALASGPAGLRDIRRIIRAAPAHLVEGGWLLLEHGWEQGAQVRALLAEAGFAAIATARDLEQRERVSLGRRGG